MENVPKGLSDLADKLVKETDQDHHDLADSVSARYGEHMGSFIQATLASYSSFAMTRAALVTASGMPPDLQELQYFQFMNPFSDMILNHIATAPINATHQQRQELYDMTMKMLAREDARMHSVVQQIASGSFKN